VCTLGAEQREDDRNLTNRFSLGQNTVSKRKKVVLESWKKPGQRVRTKSREKNNKRRIDEGKIRRQRNVLHFPKEEPARENERTPIGKNSVRR